MCDEWRDSKKVEIKHGGYPFPFILALQPLTPRSNITSSQEGVAGSRFTLPHILFFCFSNVTFPSQNVVERAALRFSAPICTIPNIYYTHLLRYILSLISSPSQCLGCFLAGDVIYEDNFVKVGNIWGPSPCLSWVWNL